MTNIEKKSIKQQIDFEKYKNGQCNEIISLLDSANSAISKYIRKTSSISTKKRYTEIARKLKDVSKALKENIGTKTDADVIIEYELEKQKAILKSVSDSIKQSNGLTVSFLYPTLEQIKTSALFKPVDTKYGMTYQSYLESIETGLYNTWDSAIRTGYLTGMPTKEIVENVIGGISQTKKITQTGSINAFRNSLYANTRTVLQAFANETQRRIYEENEKYLGGEDEYKFEYLSTLDARTCLVCGELSGKLFKSIRDAPKLPLHRGCRCVIIPYYDIKGDVKASKNGYVSADTSFEQWLTEQDADTQKEVLGTTRYRLFSNGERIKDFVDNGQTLTLKELTERNILK